jgi:hypothetical protein
MAVRKPRTSTTSKPASGTPASAELRASDRQPMLHSDSETDALIMAAEKLESVSKSFSEQQVEQVRGRALQTDVKRIMTDIMGALERISLATSERPDERLSSFTRAAYEREGSCECSCIAPGCCCYEIMLDRLRGIQTQGILEPADAGQAPALGSNDLEVRLFVSLDSTNVGLLIPSLFTTMPVPIPSALAGGGPGVWIPINQVIGRVYLRKGTSRTVALFVQASEIDEGQIERPGGLGSDEHGEANGSITLDCCTPVIYAAGPVDLSFTRGDAGGGQPGAISMTFSARRVCC